jgi:hypothetical protein
MLLYSCYRKKLSYSSHSNQIVCRSFMWSCGCVMARLYAKENACKLASQLLLMECSSIQFELNRLISVKFEILSFKQTILYSVSQVNRVI